MRPSKSVDLAWVTQDRSPAWSPDGRWLAFERAGHLYVIKVDGTGLRRLTRRPPGDREAAWSPNGRYIAFTALGRSLFVMRGDGTGVRRLYRGAPAPLKGRRGRRTAGRSRSVLPRLSGAARLSSSSATEAGCVTYRRTGCAQPARRSRRLGRGFRPRLVARRDANRLHEGGLALWQLRPRRDLLYQCERLRRPMGHH